MSRWHPHQWQDDSRRTAAHEAMPLARGNRTGVQDSPSMRTLTTGAGGGLDADPQRPARRRYVSRWSSSHYAPGDPRRGFATRPPYASPNRLDLLDNILRSDLSEALPESEPLTFLTLQACMYVR